MVISIKDKFSKIKRVDRECILILMVINMLESSEVIKKMVKESYSLTQPNQHTKVNSKTISNKAKAPLILAKLTENSQAPSTTKNNLAIMVFLSFLYRI